MGFRPKRGSALVLALFALLLISVTVLAFFAQARLNRQIAFSSASQARAGVLARSAGDFITASLVAEVFAGSGTAAHAPSAPANLLPYSMADDLGLGGGDLPRNLIKWTSDTAPLWRGANGHQFTNLPDPPAVAAATDEPSANGRWLSPALWGRAFTASGTGRLSAAVTPRWVLLSRNGPADPTAAVTDRMTNPAASNSGYIIGRYACVVYDTGGLLDINAAGYPADFAATDAAGKGSVACADLTKLGLSASDVDRLVKNHRNLRTAVSGSAYLLHLNTSGGFLTVANGDSTFVSRQDFLQAARQLGLGDHYPQFTTFSREKNTPSWGPNKNASDWGGNNTPGTLSPSDPDTGAAPTYDYFTKRDTAAAHNRFLPNVTVSATFQRLGGETARVGEPLLKHRFDLSRIDWLRHDGSKPDGVTDEDIYNSFGLRRVPDGTDKKGVNIGGAWEYDHGGRANGRVKICTLQEVADAQREPDFFELLQAVILRGSLGLTTGYPNAGADAVRGEFRRLTDLTFFNVDKRGSLINAPIGRLDDLGASFALVYAQEKYQIIQIGANIIDQWDADSFPTEIRIGNQAFYGVENLPYILSTGQTAVNFYDGAVDSAKFPTDFHMYVHTWANSALWNPHRNAADLLNAPASLRPKNIRILASAGMTWPQVHAYSQRNELQFVGDGYQPRTFLSYDQPVKPSHIDRTTQYPEGPAWVAIHLDDYRNCPEPTDLINSGIDHAYTEDASNPAAKNLNHGYGIVRSQYGWKRAAIYTGWTLAPENPFKIPQTAPFYPYYNDPQRYYLNSDGSFKLDKSGNKIMTDGYRLYRWKERMFYPPLSDGAVVYAIYGAQLKTNTATGALEARGGPLKLELQYEDLNTAGTWHTYQTINGLTNDIEGRGNPFMEENDPTWMSNYDVIVPDYYTKAVEISGSVVYQEVGPNVKAREMITGNSTSTVPAKFKRPDYRESVALYFSDPRAQRTNLQLAGGANSGGDATNASFLAYNFFDNNIVLDRQFSWGPHFYRDGVAPAENNTNTALVYKTMSYWASNEQANGTYYTDRDFVLRRGDAVGGQTVAPQAAANAARRPVMLNRRFRSVAELGFVFRDDPWKNLNLFTANSADLGLLDVFYLGAGQPPRVSPPPAVLAGKLNLNSLARAGNRDALLAILSGAAQDYTAASSGAAAADPNDLLSVSDADNIAKTILDKIAEQPLSSLGDLPALMQTVSGNTATDDKTNFSTYSKARRETMLRALTDSAQTRTWNLLVDLVAQTGRYRPGAANVRDFVVEGEQHYWLHLAIDRFTGEVVDRQLEPVRE